MIWLFSLYLVVAVWCARGFWVLVTADPVCPARPWRWPLTAAAAACTVVVAAAWPLLAVVHLVERAGMAIDAARARRVR